MKTMGHIQKEISDVEGAASQDSFYPRYRPGTGVPHWDSWAVDKQDCSAQSLNAVSEQAGNCNNADPCHCHSSKSAYRFVEKYIMSLNEETCHL